MEKIAMRSALAETTWMDALRRVRNRIALVAAAICAAAPLSSQADTGPLSSINDVRVAPLLTTHWNQGSVDSALCYNYYTPLNRVCGCTATAIGQIMYYHRYPTTRILPGETLYDDIDGYGSYSVGRDGNGGMTRTSDGLYTAFNPPYGGPYDWGSMVDSPTGATSENARKAIGLLTRDAGFAVFSHYFGAETSGYTAAIASSVILNLHYADAVRTTGFNADKLIANLDAGLPIQIGLTAHAVVADGYGYHNGKLYIHINYGYGGNKDGWYDPTTDVNGKSIQDMVANIFPPTRGARHSSVISGRVLDANGDPVANATVTATGATNVTTTSSAKGTYAFILPAGNYTFTATSGGDTGALSNCVVEASSQNTRGEIEEPWNNVGFWSSGVNNSKSGVNVTLGKTVSANEPDEYLEYVQSDGHQWVDLANLTQTATMKFDADIEWLSDADNATFIGQNFHARNLFMVNSGTIRCKWFMQDNYAPADTGVSPGDGQRHRFVVTAQQNQKLSVTVDGGTPVYSANNSDRSINNPDNCSLYLFAQHGGGGSGSVNNYSSVKLYGLKVYGADGGLVLDLVPARKGGVAGLYDRQNDGWYISGSGTALIAGPVVNPELKERFHTDALGRFAKRAQDFDVGAYVQDGLIAHFDGIRNAGADLPHDSSARTWKNLVAGQPDAKFYCNNAVSQNGNWNAAGNGFFFDGQEAAMLDSGIDIGTKFTFQLVTDIDPTQQHTQNTTGSTPYKGQYPTYFSPNTVDDGFYSNNSGSTPSTQVIFKHNDGQGWVSGTRPAISTWNGKYLTGIVGDSMAYLVQGTALVDGQSCSGHKSIGARQYAWGGKTSGTDRFIYGTYHSVRIYNVTLTDAQLAQNRYVDEVRFRGAFTADDVDIVIATDTPGVEGVEPSGEYMVNGSHTFSAANVWVGDNEWAPTGYTLEKWNGSGWTPVATSTDTSFAYTNCLANGKMLLTWNFEQQAAQGARLVHRWSFTSDYSDSVGGSTGTLIGSALAIENGEVVMSGNGYGAGSLNLGNGVMPSGDATIEIWATRTGVKKWARIFDIGSSTREYFTMSWVNDTDGTKEQVILRKNNVSDPTANTMLYASDVKYHISVTFKANNDGSTTVSWARRNVETGALEKSGSKTYSGWTLAAIAAGNFYLGHSQWSDNYDANAKYDEVRIWNGVVGDDQLAANAAMGPDVYTSGFEEGFRLAGNAVFNIPADGYAASGDVVLGAGSKLCFDTSSMHYDESVSFSATGFNIPSGSILDYVEPQDSANFSVTFSENTITVTRLRQNEPDAYLEYVESDGRQYIDTGVNPNANMTIDADVDLMANGIFMGVSHYESYPIECTGGYIAGRLLKSAYATSGVVTNTGRHRVVASATGTSKKFTISVDDWGVVNSTGNVSQGSASQSMYVFQGKWGDSVCPAKLYGLKIYINGELKRDFVPGIKNTVAGLYDRQNDAWYHSGSGIELIPGPVVNPQNLPDAYLDYVKSTGSQWVSVGVPLTQTMKFDVDVDWISGNTLIGQNSYGLCPLQVKSETGTISSWWWMYDGNAAADTGVALDTGRRRFVITTSNSAYVSTSVDGGTPALSGGYSNRSGVNPSDLYLFAKHFGGAVGNAGDYTTAKLYGLKIYGANGGLVRDYVPGIKDNVVGLYDRVCDKFVSSGSGTPLVAGPVVDRSKPDSFVEYVESNGSQWVDTGVDGRPGVKSEADIDWISGAPLGVIGNGHCLLLQGLGGDKIGGQAHYSQETVTTVAVNSGRHVVVSEACAGSKMTITVDGTTSAESPDIVYNYDTGATIWMFAAHSTGGGAWGAGRSKFYGLKLWRTGTDGVCRIQRHFIPCVKDNRAGLYDAVSGVIFYSHSGTDLTASSTEVPLAVWRNEADDASLDNAANWCGDLQNATDAVVCAPWLPAVSSENGFAVSNLTVTGGNLAFANGTITVEGTLTADGVLTFANLVINGRADGAVTISGSISGHGTVKSLTLAEGARFIPDGTGYLTVSDALAGTMLIDMTDINLSGMTGRFPLFKTGTVDILPAATAVEFVGGRPPSGRKLVKAKSGFGYDLGVSGFAILLR